jgi:pimeloyl-ACP methyl ester carboxylesterase
MPSRLRRELRAPVLADLPSGATHYLVTGPADGATVVFVPGATLPLFVWDGLADAVATAGYRAVRYDLLGRGDSAAPGVVYDEDLHRRQLAELITAIDPAGPVHLVSLAFGCLVAADYARDRPDRVASLTHIAPDGFGVPLPRVTRVLRLPIVGDALVKLVGTRILLKRLADYSADPQIVAALREQFEPYAHAPGLHRAVLSSIRHMPIHDAVDTYARMAVPSQVLWGSADRVTPLAPSGRLSAAFPGAPVTILEGVGHLPHVERPDQVAAAVLGFVGSIRA